VFGIIGSNEAAHLVRTIPKLKLKLKLKPGSGKLSELPVMRTF
jgi:hypothetical protein